MTFKKQREREREKPKEKKSWLPGPTSNWFTADGHIPVWLDLIPRLRCLSGKIKRAGCYISMDEPEPVLLEVVVTGMRRRAGCKGFSFTNSRK